MPESSTAEGARCHLGRIGGRWALAQGKAWVGAGADTHCLGRVNSSSSRTGHGTGKGNAMPQRSPELNLQKYRSSSWRRASQHNGISPIPVTHVIGQPGAIPPVRPRGNVVQISYSSTLNLRSKTLPALLLTGIILLWIYLQNRRSLPRFMGMMCRARQPTSGVPENPRIEGQLCFFLTCVPLQPRRASVSASETSLRHTLVYLLPACLPEKR